MLSRWSLCHCDARHLVLERHRWQWSGGRPRAQVFTGFRKYNVQAVMNNPIWGLDNQIYVAGSSNGGSVIAPGQSEQRPIAARGDFRIDPRTHSFELQAGGARFGNTFDDWGNRFLCNIRNPAIHVVLDNRYLAQSVLRRTDRCGRYRRVGRSDADLSH